MDPIAITQLLGNVGEFVGAIAVVATLFYLSVQVRESNAQTRREEISSTFQQISSLRIATAQNPDLADLRVAGNQDFAGLSPSAQLRYHSILSEHLWFYYNLWDRVRTNRIEDEFWVNVRLSVAEMLSAVGTQRWWLTGKHQFPSAFVAKIERAVAEFSGRTSAP